MTSDTSGAHAAESASPAAPADTRIRVLLVEDHESFVFLIRDMLVRKGGNRYLFREASNLEAGIAIMRTTPLDVILLDLGLPDCQGFLTFAKTRANAPDAAIIILTALADEDLAMQAMRHGAQEYLVKDEVTPNILIRAIRYAIERVRAERSIRQLTGRLLGLQDEERRRLARALHDTTAQNLTALSLNLSLLDRLAQNLEPKARELLTEARTDAERCATELRTMAYLLHPPLLDELGLTGAVREYADGFAERSGLRVDLEISPDLGRLPKEHEVALFRTLQECLTNIQRHSGSATASIRLLRDAQRVSLEVADVGRGIEPQQMLGAEGVVLSAGVGIPGMRERMKQLGGRLDIESNQGGTVVRAVLPVAGATP
jgi:signal transduction histidine kinase